MTRSSRSATCTPASGCSCTAPPVASAAGRSSSARAGARVTATVRRAELRDAVRELGADAVIDPEGFAEHGPFDVVLELIGAPNIPDDLGALDTDGRIVVIGVGAGFKAEVNLLALMASARRCAPRRCARGRWRRRR